MRKSYHFLSICEGSGAKLVPKTEQIDTLGALVSHVELNKSLTPHDMVEMELQKSKPFWLMVPLGK